MNKCFRCGFEVSENANFCSNCGIALKDPMPEIVYLKVEETQHEEVVIKEDFAPEAETEHEELLKEETTKNDYVVIVESIADTNAPTESLKEEITEDDQRLEETIETESTGEKSRKIFWMPEWAFYSMILILGIIGIIAYKFVSDPSWSKLFEYSFYSEDDTISQIDGLNESANLSVDIVDSVYEDSVFTPLMNALDADTDDIVSTSCDSAYHVVVMTLRSLESAQKMVDEGKFGKAYIISDSTLNRIAIYSSPNKDNAKHYLDSVANNGFPSAWVFYGPAK